MGYLVVFKDEAKSKAAKSKPSPRSICMFHAVGAPCIICLRPINATVPYCFIFNRHTQPLGLQVARHLGLGVFYTKRKMTTFRPEAALNGNLNRGHPLYTSTRVRVLCENMPTWPGPKITPGYTDCRTLINYVTSLHNKTTTSTHTAVHNAAYGRMHNT